MPRSNNPFDLINALEEKCEELSMTASTDIKASSESTCNKYLDVDGVFGVPGHEITWDQIVDYWNNNYNDDPILSEYSDFDKWWMDTESHLTPIEECNNINASDDLIPEERKYVDDLEDKLREAMGAEGLLDAITKYLGYAEKREMYEYISRVYEAVPEDEEDITPELAQLLVDYFENNPKESYSPAELKAYFDYKGYDLTIDQVNEVWEYCVDNVLI